MWKSMNMSEAVSRSMKTKAVEILGQKGWLNFFRWWGVVSPPPPQKLLWVNKTKR